MTAVCLYANTVKYPRSGGHLWVYLNWALGFRSAGCDVTWLEEASGSGSGSTQSVEALRTRLKPFGFADDVVVARPGGASAPGGTRSLRDAADEADLLFNMNYDCRPEVVGLFRRSALLDIDPGLVQMWMLTGQLDVGEHDVYFTTGETVGQPGGLPDGGVVWHYTPPAVHLDSWPVTDPPASAPYTTVTHWWHNWEMWREEEVFDNSKRASFQEFLDLPGRTSVGLELAVSMGDEEAGERRQLESAGWSVRGGAEAAGTASDYRRYIQRSRGEFSCAKPSCMRLQNAWISDRTLCYLATGNPAVVQHTGPSRFLPDGEGLFRFRTVEEAVKALETAESDYERHCRSARELAEEYFDATHLAASVLERAL